SSHALDRSDPLCDQALDLFVAAYGAQAANLALTAIATGGVYLAGGITPRIGERLGAGGFLAAFRNKGRMVELLDRLPVYAVLNPNVGLLGAAAVAARQEATGP
ncbi:MAG TPA: glucokinase, partial [Gemmatimonadales bacterium]|nr:glucokinase [Gemmatimonadales bacterium]